MPAPVFNGVGIGRGEWAIRVAVLAAALCPALSSLGGSIVAVLVLAAGFHLRRRPDGWPA